MTTFRVEKDSLGEVRVPRERYYGAQTQRAVENFPISSRRFPRGFIRALGLIKKAAAEVNAELELLDAERADAIVRAADDVIAGELDAEFVVDIFQTGSGTSTNMNANEVIANRAIELLGGELGSRDPVHPNDHVNAGQSSNDVIPTALHVAAAEAVNGALLPALRALEGALSEQARVLDAVVKIGRTHLQDAVPVRMGQEFSGYAAQLERGIARVEGCAPRLVELAIGGTAVGTGLNCPEGFAEGVVSRIAAWTGIDFVEAGNRFEAIAARDAAVELSGQLKTVAVSLMKIANDLRWLSSGPRCGIGELRLPAVQPGSSIMPGKVNPVLPEAMMMVCAQVMANDVAISLGGQHGNFELNAMQPLIVSNLLESIAILANGCDALRERCVEGLEANVERARGFIEQSISMATALAPEIGYDAAASIAKRAFAEGRTVREVARERSGLSDEALEAALDPRRQTGGGQPG